MTRMRGRNLECPHFKHILWVNSHSSINTWMDLEAIIELMNAALHRYT